MGNCETQSQGPEPLKLFRNMKNRLVDVLTILKYFLCGWQPVTTGDHRNGTVINIFLVHFY